MYHLRNGYGSIPNSPVWSWTYETIIERYERAAKFWDPRLVDASKHTARNHPGPGDVYKETEELHELFSRVGFFDEEARVSKEQEQNDNDLFSGRKIQDKRSDDRKDDHDYFTGLPKHVPPHGYGYGCGGGGRKNKAGIGISYVDEGIITLYQCTFCGNSSAALKKCGRCGDVKYCDAKWSV
jgi:hypothetical protein